MTQRTATPRAHHSPDLPASLVPARTRRPVAGATAGADAARVTVHAPYTGAPLTTPPVSAPTEVEEASARARAPQVARAAGALTEQKGVPPRFPGPGPARQDEAPDPIRAQNGSPAATRSSRWPTPAVTAHHSAPSASRHLEPRRRHGRLPGHPPDSPALGQLR
ncbi:hypothetical protein [Streptomyces sp. NPDC005438]|uniref:hypothetical protein n=1 Tax=Streptomyces sp. NPDC005438 TaxID=3156880 RepID=UPI0033AAEC09